MPQLLPQTFVSCDSIHTRAPLLLQLASQFSRNENTALINLWSASALVLAASSISHGYVIPLQASEPRQIESRSGPGNVSVPLHREPLYRNPVSNPGVNEVQHTEITSRAQASQTEHALWRRTERKKKIFKRGGFLKGPSRIFDHTAAEGVYKVARLRDKIIPGPGILLPSTIKIEKGS